MLQTSPKIIEASEPVAKASVSGSQSVMVLSPSSLPEAMRKAWVRIQEENSELKNPFFRIEFVEELASVRENVRVAVVRRGNEPLAFFPFQEIRPGVAIPVGEKIGCMHGIIADPSVDIDALELFEACGLSAWRFDHLLASQKLFQPYHYEICGSPYMDLSSGYQAYCQDRKAKGHTNRAFAELGRKTRRMEREVGPLRLEVDSRDLSILDKLVEWKTAQMADTGKRNLFAYSPWVVPLLTRALQIESDVFRGMMAVLFVNDVPISIHYGFKSRDQLHGIFFAYNKEYARFSPGMGLVLKLVQQAHDHGINRIDMGKGDEPYKQMWKSDSTPIAIGGYEKNAMLSAIRPPAHRVKRVISKSFLGPPAKQMLGQIQKAKDRFAP